MKTVSKRFALLLAVCMLFAAVCVTGVSAASPLDLTASCTITFDLSRDSYPDLYDSDGNALVVADLYRVAYAEPITGVDGFTFSLRDVYAELPNPGEAGVDAAALAQTAMGIALNRDEPIATIAANKAVTVEAGLYLILIHARDANSEVTTTTNEKGQTVLVTTALDVSGKTRYLFNPVLMSVPRKPMDENGSVNTANPGEWIYHDQFSVKAGRKEHHEKQLILHKTDEEGNKLPGAKFKLYATRLVGDATITDDTIITYVDGIGYVTLYCIGEYITDENGDILIDPDVMDDDVLYAWVETEAPSTDYELDPEPHFFFAYRTEDYYGGETPTYHDSLNGYGLYYDPKHPNGDGPLKVERSFDDTSSGLANKVTFKNISDEPISVKATAFGMEGFNISVTPMFEDWASDDEGNSFCVLEAGESRNLYVLVRPESVSSELGLSRVAIVYDYAPYGQGFDWRNPPREGGENRLPGTVGVQPMRDAHGGYDVDLTEGDKTDLRDANISYIVEGYTYDEKNVGKVGVTVVNKKAGENPPDEPGTELPSTGGRGTAPFYIAGSGLIAIALFLLAVRKHRRKA